MNAMSQAFPAAPRVDRVPVEPYVSESYYHAEQEKIFRRCWLNVGSVQQVPKPGDYFTREIRVLDMSLLVVRGRDNQVRAFHNVCTHRANQLTNKSCGTARAFTCAVHGWTFDLQGKLSVVPTELTLPGFDKSSRGLTALSVGIWHGFIFIHPDTNPDMTLEEFLGPLNELTRDHPFSQWERFGRYSMDAKCNWKTFQVSFMESSHVKTIHQRTVEDYAAEVVPPDFAVLGSHTEMTFYTSLHHTPYPVEQMTIDASPGFMMNSNRLTHPGLNREKQSNWMFNQFGIFPNFLLFLGDGWATSHIFWPDGQNKTYWEGCYYAEASERPSQAMANHYFGLKLRDTVREDLEAVEAMQRGMRSGALTDLVLCGEEALIGHHYKVSESYLKSTTS